MRRPIHLWWALAVVLVAGCDYESRIKSLEKDDQEIKEQIKKQNAIVDYDLQAKCAKDSRVWFNENWSRDKDTILLDYSNHYNKAQNKCFVFVEYHYNFGENGSWINHMGLWDVYENLKYAEFDQWTTVVLKPQYEARKRVNTCEVYGKKCVSVDEFNDLLRTYLNN